MAKSATRAKAVSKSTRAGLTFPVGRIGSQLKKGRYGKRVSAAGAVFLTAVLEYATNELLTLSAEAATTSAPKGGKKTKKGAKQIHNIKPRHIMTAVRNDDDLSTLLDKVTIAGGGVTENIHEAIAGKKEKKEKKAKKSKKN